MKTEKIKLAEIEGIVRSLGSIASKELPIRTSYNISKIAKAVTGEYELFVEKRRQIAERYAEKDKDGTIVTEGPVIKIDPEKIPIAQEELDELMVIEFELSFKPIKLEELESINIAPADLLKLHIFLEDDGAK